MTQQLNGNPLSKKASAYLQFGQVPAVLATLRSKEYPVSSVSCKDPESDRTLYFVDLVQEGGGVLGVALVGYTYALEEAGIRFLSLAGTSAGAVNTMLMAGCGKPVEAKSKVVLDVLAQKNFADFVDPGWRVLWPLQGIMHPSWLVKIPAVIALFLLNLPGFLFKRGLCTGNAFERWIGDILCQRKDGPKSIGDLIKRMNDLPENLKIKPLKGHPVKAKGLRARLAIIAADVTTQTKVEFPKMADLYVPSRAPQGDDLETFGHVNMRPADVVRASMAIPVFFRPKYFCPPEKGAPASEKWKRVADYNGQIPDKIIMVDGGIMSNFPIDVFHEVDRTPSRPTFGVRLGLSRSGCSVIRGLFSLLGAAFNGARNIRDFEFLFKNEDYKYLVQYIDINSDKYNWLDFAISEQRKKELFELGVLAARDFLEGKDEKKGFDWEQYQALRRRILFFSSTDRMESLWTKEDAVRKLGLAEKDIVRLSAQAAGYSELKSIDPNQIELADTFASFDEQLKIIEKYTKHNRTVSVLWVDDDPVNDCFELSVLRAFNINFVTALNNEEALEKLAVLNDFQVVVTDSSRQGDLNKGLELCHQLYIRNLSIPVILHSVSQAKKTHTEAEKTAFIRTIRREFSPYIVGNFIDARELVLQVVKEIAKVIQQKEPSHQHEIVLRLT